MPEDVHFHKGLDEIDRSQQLRQEKQEGRTQAQSHQRYLSSVHESEQEAEMSGATAAFPILPFPFLSASEYADALSPDFSDAIVSGVGATAAASISMHIQRKMNEICINMLDQWGESIKEIEKQRRVERESNIVRKQEEFLRFQLPLDTYLQQAQALKDEERLLPVSAVTASFIIGAGLLLQGTAVVATASTTAAAPAAAVTSTNAVQSIHAALVKLIPEPIVKGALAVVGGIFAAGTVYQTTIATWLTGGLKGGKMQGAKFALNYAAELTRLIDDARFNSFIKSLCVNAGKTSSTPISEERYGQLAAIVKLVLLVAALAMLYKVETGHLTSQEVGEMISKKLKLPDDDPRQPILAHINAQLAELDPKERVRILEGLFEYVDANPKVEELLEPSKVFESLSQNILKEVKG